MKKKIAVMLAVTALVTSSLVSCGGKKMPDKERVDHVYKTTEVDIGNIDYASQILAAGDELIIRAQKVTDSENGKVERHIIRMSGDGEVKSDEIMSEIGERMNLRQLISDQSGKLYAVVVQYTDEDSLFSLCDFDGTTIGDTIIEDIGDMFEEEVDTSARPWMSGFYLRGAAIDADGNFIFVSETAVAAADKDGKKLFETTVDNGDIRDIMSSSDGRVYISYMDYADYNDVVCEIDAANKRLDDPIGLPSGDNDIRNADFYFAPGHDLYYKTTLGVYAVDIAEDGTAGEAQLLLDFVNSDLLENELQYFTIISSERMIAMNYTYDEGSQTSSTTVYLLDHVPDEEVPEKYVLELAVAYSDQTTIQRVVRFNRSSDEYRVKLSVWDQRDEESGNYTLGEELLGQRILSGDVPDIIETSGFSKASDWTTAGSFVDLNEMIEKDEDFDQSKVFMNVINKFERGGKLFLMPVNYSIMTLAAKRANIPFDSWTPGEFIEYAKALDDGQYMTAYGGKLQTLTLLINNSLTHFVDRSAGTCDFDNDEFRAILEFSASQPDTFSFISTLPADDQEDYRNNDRNRMYRENRVILDTSYIHEISSMLSDEVSIGAGEEVVFIGYPCYEGNGSVLQASESYSVFKGSELKDGAWEFVKSALFEGSSRIGYMGFPVSAEAFDKMMATYSDQHYFFRFNGGYNGWSGDELIGNYDDGSGVLRDVTQADIDKVKALIDGATATPDIDQTASDMIMEEVQSYFAGDKSLDETVKVIQSRVGIYLAEKQ